MDLLEDARFATGRHRTAHHWEIVKILQETFRTQPRGYWLERLDANNISNAPINSIEEVFDDPQVKHMGIPKQIDHPKMGKSNLIGSPINLSDTPPQFFRPAPLLGENTEEILERLGYSKEVISELRSSGVI
jgi:crotonobetainyl-CoA:carnitine CoA-transferase CaiB-like acyl-CoA transferase